MKGPIWRIMSPEITQGSSEAAKAAATLGIYRWMLNDEQPSYLDDNMQDSSCYSAKVRLLAIVTTYQPDKGSIGPDVCPSSIWLLPELRDTTAAIVFGKRKRD